MKRDMELVRKILFSAELSTPGQPDLGGLVAEYGEQAVAYHSYLAMQAGLVDTIGDDETPLDPGATMSCVITGLTWQGHDFVELARSNPRWEKVKAKVLDALGGLTLEALKAGLKMAAGQVVSAIDFG